MQTIQLQGHGGLRLIADRHGDSSAPPVLLLHGGGQTRQSWGDTARALADAGYQPFALDLRGHGESSWSPDGTYTHEVLCGDLSAVIAEMPQPPVLVGASIGGALGMIVAAENPSSLRALVLVDVAPRLEPTGVSAVIGFMRAHPQGFGSLEEAADVIATYLPQRSRLASPGGLERVLRRGGDDRWHWHWDPAFVGDDWQQQAERLGEHMRRAARRIYVPTLLIRGQLSEVISAESAAELARDIPQLEYSDIVGAGHMVAGDRNDRATEALLRFLERHPPPRQGQLAV